eukprot:scaffold197101_cov22-Prasinocladus_malaysianus.AAC.1
MAIATEAPTTMLLNVTIVMPTGLNYVDAIWTYIVMVMVQSDESCNTLNISIAIHLQHYRSVLAIMAVMMMLAVMVAERFLFGGAIFLESSCYDQ